MSTDALLLAGTWSVDTAATTVAFVARGIGGSRVHGRFPVVRGTVVVDGSGRLVRVEAAVDAAGVATGNQRRDDDLRGKRFLQVQRFPELVLRWDGTEESAGVRGPDEADGWTLPGVLDVRGTRAPLPLRVVPVGGAPRVTADVPADGAVRVVGTGTLDLRITPIRPPGFLVGRHVQVRIEAVLRRSHE